jgi:HD-GYP domain-containing protein (c-di-GMP phosphodiesterase class II)
LQYGAILHDIGKIGIPDSILKKPFQLNENEWNKIRQHPLIGAEIIAAIPHLAGVAQIVLYHHEHFDGGGYPLGLKGNAIPLAARILAVVDAYGAIVEARVYKAARSHEAAIAELIRCSGTQFDPDVLRSFLRLAKKSRYSRRPIVREESAARRERGAMLQECQTSWTKKQKWHSGEGNSVECRMIHAANRFSMTRTWLARRL